MTSTTSSTNDLITHWTHQVTQAALAFEGRWTLATLRRVDGNLCTRFLEQRDLFWEARIEGSGADIAKQGAGLCRGYAAILKRMDEAEVPDDAYLLGQCYKTGLKVAVGEQKAAAERVRELYGDQVIWLSPDELAALVASCAPLRQLVAVKKEFPGAEVMRVGIGYQPDPVEMDVLAEVETA